MSRENVEIVRSIYSAWERGDVIGAHDADPANLVAASYEWFDRHREPPPIWHPDGEFISARENPDHATHRGAEAVHDLNQGWFDAYPDLRSEPLEIRANGNLVFVWIRFRGHGARSGAPTEQELAHVVTVEGGEIRCIQEYSERAAGLRAVGLEE